MLIEYNQQAVFMNSLDIVDPGNTCVRITYSDFSEYFVLIKTIAGSVNMLKIGPIVEDLAVLFDGFSASFKKFNYNEAKIEREISQLANDSKKSTISVEELLLEEAYEMLPNVVEIFKRLED